MGQRALITCATRVITINNLLHGNCDQDAGFPNNSFTYTYNQVVFALQLGSNQPLLKNFHDSSMTNSMTEIASLADQMCSMQVIHIFITCNNLRTKILQFPVFHDIHELCCCNLYFSIISAAFSVKFIKCVKIVWVPPSADVTCIYYNSN